jgi:O-antigen/teichoic acid export membrane protein
MTARSELLFDWPDVILGRVNPSNKFIERYRTLPARTTSIFAAILALALATVWGFLAAYAAMYLYDRGTSKGDDAAVALGGLFAVGTFTFVVVFTWLQKAHHTISSRTSLFAFYACLVLPALITVMSADEMDYYSMFIVSDWLAILIFGALALLVCRRWWHHEEQGF